MIKLLIILLLPFPVFALIITEVQIHGDLADNDYIKVYNQENHDLNVSGYKIRKKTSTGTESSVRVFPKDTIIPAKDYLIWANSRDDFHLQMKADVWSTAYLAKNNSIAILDNKDNLLDSLSWGEIEKSFKENDNFSKNPERNQALKRKEKNSIYQDTNNKNKDFYLFPEEIKKETVITEKIELPKFTPEKDYSYLFRGFLIALIGGFLILGLKKALDFS